MSIKNLNVLAFINVVAKIFLTKHYDELEFITDWQNNYKINEGGNSFEAEECFVCYLVESNVTLESDGIMEEYNYNDKYKIVIIS